MYLTYLSDVYPALEEYCCETEYVYSSGLFVRTNHCKVCKRGRNCEKCTIMNPIGAAPVLLQLLFV